MNSQRTLQNNVLEKPTFPCSARCQPCVGVAEIDVKIAELKQALALLEHDRRMLLSNANANHDTTNRLPLEIFTTILELALPTPDSFHRRSPRLDILGPLVFSAVSRRWKHIVHSTPSLWTVIPIMLQRAERLPAVMGDLMAEWIGRTGKLPISIIFKKLSRGMDPTSVINLINQNSHRLYRLYIESRFSMARALDFTANQATTLVDFELKLVDLDYEYHFATEEHLDFRRRLGPLRLQKLHLDYISATQFDFCANRLTHVSLRGHSWDDCILIFTQAPKLIELALYDIEEDCSDTPIKVTHQTLQSLRFSQTEPPQVIDMMNCLTCPNLLHIDVRPDEDKDNYSSAYRDVLHSIRRCVRRSSAPLRSLTLHDIELCGKSSDIQTALDILLECVKGSLTQLNVKKKRSPYGEA